jgi:hypothetical protein
LADLADADVDAAGDVDGEYWVDIFTLLTLDYTGEEFRIGYRKGPGRAGGKLTRSILLNSSTIPKRKESGSGSGRARARV